LANEISRKSYPKTKNIATTHWLFKLVASIKIWHCDSYVKWR